MSGKIYFIRFTAQVNLHFNTFIWIVFVADVVDPNRDGHVSLQEYMAFMISKETENVQSSEEIEKAFRAITAGDRPYVTKEELYAVSYLFLSSCKKSWDELIFWQIPGFLAELDERNGGLLRGEDEAVHGTQDRTTHRGCSRLHRIYTHTFPELII